MTEMRKDDADPDGATPLDADELDELIPRHIATRGELNAWEQANILQALTSRARLPRDILTADYVKALHRRMFNLTWRWAGSFRKTDKNIGVDWPRIAESLHDLLADVVYWIANDSYSHDEIAVRFHHRLVSIHPFSNGNGRHGRLMTDQLLKQLGELPFTWGAAVTRVRRISRHVLACLSACR